MTVPLSHALTEDCCNQTLQVGRQADCLGRHPNRARRSSGREELNSHGLQHHFCIVKVVGICLGSTVARGCGGRQAQRKTAA